MKAGILVHLIQSYTPNAQNRVFHNMEDIWWIPLNKWIYSFMQVWIMMVCFPRKLFFKQQICGYLYTISEKEMTIKDILTLEEFTKMITKWKINNYNVVQKESFKVKRVSNFFWQSVRKSVTVRHSHPALRWNQYRQIWLVGLLLYHQFLCEV